MPRGRKPAGKAKAVPVREKVFVEVEVNAPGLVAAGHMLPTDKTEYERKATGAFQYHISPRYLREMLDLHLPPDLDLPLKGAFAVGWLVTWCWRRLDSVADAGGWSNELCSASLRLWRVAAQGRGEPENPIEELEHGFSGDRLSCHRFLANAFQLSCHA